MYRLCEPAAELRPYIENYWFVSHAPGDEVELRVDVFVDARADLVFNLEAPYRRVVVGGQTSEIAGSTLDAQRLVPIRIEQRGLVTIVGVRFRLGGLAPFTRESLDRWSGSTPPPTAVLGSDAGDLERALRRSTELQGSTDMQASAAMLDAFFLGACHLGDAERSFERALATLVTSGGSASLAELAAAAAVSERQVQRLFASRLGFPPRTVARVVRFQDALRRLMTDPGVPLGDVASAAGYYDQAHFVREFREFTGGVPRGYRGYYPPQGPADFAPNVVAYIQDGEAPAR